MISSTSVIAKNQSTKPRLFRPKEARLIAFRWKAGDCGLCGGAYREDRRTYAHDACWFALTSEQRDELIQMYVYRDSVATVRPEWLTSPEEPREAPHVPVPFPLEPCSCGANRFQPDVERWNENGWVHTRTICWPADDGSAHESYRRKPAPLVNARPPIETAAERAFVFLVGLNLQDHPRAEQRDYLDVVRELKAALAELDPKRREAASEERKRGA